MWAERWIPTQDTDIDVSGEWRVESPDYDSSEVDIGGPTMFRFEKLDDWHKSIELADRVYLITRAFPDNERFGLTSPMRRAAVSISSNIAEGIGRLSTNEFLRFIEIAYGSLMELITQALIANRQQFLSEAHYADVYQQSEQLSKMLSGLRSSLSPKHKP